MSRKVRAPILTAALVAVGLCGVASAAPDGHFPWKAGEKPPSVAGVRLGESEAEIVRALGPPGTDRPAGKPASKDVMLAYGRKGLTLICTPADGLSVITLSTQEAGDIGSVRVGDPAEEVVQRWGPPPVQNGPSGIYNAGTWSVAIKLDPTTKNIKTLMLAWNTTKWPNLRKVKPDSILRLK